MLESNCAMPTSGLLVAFDKFLNLVMVDVEEDYLVRLRVDRERHVWRWVPEQACMTSYADPAGTYWTGTPVAAQLLH